MQSKRSKERRARVKAGEPGIEADVTYTLGLVL